MSQPTNQQNPFDQFTNLYSLSKTLRFELRSHHLTKSLTEVIKKDKEIDRVYNEEMKPILDALHEEFITEALNQVVFSIKDLELLEKYFRELINLKQNLKNLNKNKEKNQGEIKIIQEQIKNLENEKSGNISNLQNSLRQVVVNGFNTLGAKWKEKYEKEGIKFKSDDNKDKQGYEILTTKGVLGILKSKHSEFPEKLENIEKFDRFFTYFKGFNQNRANYYTSDQKTTGIANRIVNVNLTIFLKNKSDFVLCLEKLPQLESYKKCFELGSFQSYLTQKDIELYNEKIGEIKKIVNLEHNQKVKDKKDILKGLTELQKQIGCKSKQERELLAKGESMYPKYLEKVGLGFHITKGANKNYQIWDCLDYLNEKLVPQIKQLSDNYNNFFEDWQNYQLDSIWFRKESLNTISGRWFGGSNWFVLTRALAYLGTGRIDKGEYKPNQFVSLQELKEAMEALENGVDFDVKKLKKKKNEVLVESVNEKADKQYSYKPENLFRAEYKDVYEGKTLFETFLAIWHHEIELNFKRILDGYIDKEGNKIKSFLQNFEEHKKETFDKNKKEHVSTVFNLMQEGYLPIMRMTRYHNLEKKGSIVPGYNTDDRFYEILGEFWKDNLINQYRNAFEATLTQKPYSEDKIKLNFENSSLAEGWDITLEPSRRAVILRKNLQRKNKYGEDEYEYYLAIIDKNAEFPFDMDKNPVLYQVSAGSWEKMKYKYFKDASLSIPKCSTQVNDVVRHFKNSNDDFILDRGASVGRFTRPLRISKEIFELNNRIYLKDDYSQSAIRGTVREEKNYVKLFQKEFLEISKDYDLYRKSLNAWIDFCKEFLKCYPSCSYFDYSSLPETGKYDSIDKFYEDVNRLSYVKTFIPINYSKLEELVKDGTIYLFQVYNKDFSKDKVKKDGKDSLETSLLKALFSEMNLEERILKLDGGAELSFRDKSIKKKKDEKRSKTFDIFINRRYTEEKYFFHFPLTINFGTKSLNQKGFNQKVLRSLAQKHTSIKVIGIDRGEKHLLYYSVVSIDKNGRFKLEDQGSFNKIETKNPVDEKKIKYEYDIQGKLKTIDLVSTGKKVNYVDYHLLLDYYEKKRKLARESWEVIGKITDLKKGYLSQVIHKLYKLMLDYEAIIVMENLNSEFKAKRGAKVEKAVYKKFELALAKKLSHLILKDKDEKPLDKGGVLKPYQLTPPIGKIGDFEKAIQWGFIFYVQPQYTSTIDPLTGWRKHLYISNDAPIEKRKDVNSKYKKASATYIKDFFNPQSGVQINYDFDKVCYKFSYEDEYGRPWDLYAYKGLSRFYFDPQERQVKPYDLYKEFEILFTNMDKNRNINEKIFERDEFNWKKLVFLWNLLNQIRNTDKVKEDNGNDFIQSPCWSNEHKYFFDSTKIIDKSMPDNGDANGAYNIARKGVMLVKKIKEHSKDDPEFKKHPDLFISDQEWDEAVADWDTYVSSS